MSYALRKLTSETNFFRLAEGIDTTALQKEIEANKELYFLYTERQNFKSSPFAGTKSIPCRMSYDLTEDMSEDDYLKYLKINGITNVQAQDTKLYDKFPAVYNVVMAIASSVKAEQIGRILIANMPPNTHIKPHKDFGDYHDFYDRFHLVVSGKGCKFRSGDEIVTMLPNEVWWFYNNLEHEVWNDTDEDRVHIVMDFKLRGNKALLKSPENSKVSEVAQC